MRAPTRTRELVVAVAGTVAVVACVAIATHLIRAADRRG